MNCRTEGCTRTGRIVKGLCNACYQRALYAADPEKFKAKAAAKRKANPEKEKAYYASWYAENAERKRAYAKQWKLDNQDKMPSKEEQASYMKDYYDKNREKLIARAAEYQKANPEKTSKKTSEWARRNPDARRVFKQTRRTRKTEAGGSFTKAEWLVLCAEFSQICPACRLPGLKLTADHIVPVSMGGTSNIDNIQPLCGPCNSRKGDSFVRYPR